MQTLLIVGFGDIARRTLPFLTGHWRLLATVRTPAQAALARQFGVLPITADLDDFQSLKRLAGLANAILYTAPPPSTGQHDPRMLKLLSVLRKAGSIPHTIVYISTSGVYGDHNGGWVTEVSPTLASTARAQRRLAAEAQLRQHPCRNTTILRAPGIYAADRLPLDRIKAGLPIAREEEDSYSNHIHADDLATICVRALRRRGGLRIYNACDSLPIKIGDWFCLLAQQAGLPAPERLPSAALQARLSPAQWSFMAESRRMRNHRLLHEFGPLLRMPTVMDFLPSVQCPAME